jgi:hypothetical protein
MFLSQSCVATSEARLGTARRTHSFVYCCVMCRVFKLQFLHAVNTPQYVRFVIIECYDRDKPQKCRSRSTGSPEKHAVPICSMQISAYKKYTTSQPSHNKKIIVVRISKFSSTETILFILNKLYLFLAQKCCIIIFFIFQTLIKM